MIRHKTKMKPKFHRTIPTDDGVFFKFKIVSQ